MYSEQHPNWKGDSVSYSGNHKWVVRHLGSAKTCELKDETCSNKFEWSNKSNKYKRDLSDWQQLCVSHHRRYDGIKPTPMYGENHGNAKLTSSKVREIRTLYQQPGISQRQLASKFSVTQTTISNILLNKIWIKS